MKKQLKYVRLEFDFVERINCYADDCKDYVNKVYFMTRKDNIIIVFFCKKHGLKHVAELVETYDMKFISDIQWHPDNCTCTDLRHHKKEVRKADKSNTRRTFTTLYKCAHCYLEFLAGQVNHYSGSDTEPFQLCDGCNSIYFEERNMEHPEKYELDLNDKFNLNAIHGIVKDDILVLLKNGYLVSELVNNFRQQVMDIQKEMKDDEQ